MVTKLQEKYSIAKEPDNDEEKKELKKKEKKKEKVNKSQHINEHEKDWYVNCWSSIKEINDIDENTIDYLIVQHMIDELSFKEIIVLLNFFYDNPVNIDKYNSTDFKYNNRDIFKHIEIYIKDKIKIGKNKIKGFLWQEKNIRTIIVKHNSSENKNNWHIAEPEDEKDLSEEFGKTKNDIMSKLSKYIGFMSNF